MTDEKKHTEKPQEALHKHAARLDPYAPKHTAVDTALDDTSPAAGSAREEYDKAYKPEPWSATPQGRLAIRTFSRGVMGSIFFTAGGLWARKKMMSENENKYDPNNSLSEIVFDKKNPFQAVAKTLDIFLGKPIEGAVNALGGDGRAAVHFKPTKFSREYNIGGEKVKVHGRTLGEEMLFVTFDFFCASIGDALGRDMVGWIDPGVKKSWMDDKGHIKWPEAVQSIAKSMFRYVTYNGGEDWAVALPYVYFMKAQRNFMDKHISPGFGFESDLGFNASSLKMYTRTSDQHRISGTYALEAMMDYQTRFTVYNIGTLMYREAYDKAEKAWHGKHVNLYGAPDAPVDPNKSWLDSGIDLVKWAARSAIKGGIYMTPAMPFFSLTRVTQARNRAIFVDPWNNSAMGFMGNDNKPHFVRVSDVQSKPDGFNKNTPVFYAQYDQSANEGRGGFNRVGPQYSQMQANPAAYDPKFDKYERRSNLLENGFSRIGRLTENMANSLDGFAKSVDDRVNANPSLRPLKRIVGLRAKPRGIEGQPGYKPADNFNSFTRGVVNSAVSYTPYMYAKAEFGKLWDTGRMDLASERLIDGVFAGKWGEARAGMGEIWNAFLHKPFADPEREKEGQRRVAIDSSASDSFEKSRVNAQPQFDIPQEKKDAMAEEFQKDMDAYTEKHAKKHAPKEKPAASEPQQELSWRERAMQGRPDPDAVMTKHAPKSHTEREEQRKFLEEASPLNTQAI